MSCFEKETKKPTIDLCARVQNLARVVSELCQMDAIFLARNSLRRLSLLHVEYLYSVIVRCGHEVISLVIEIKGGYMQWQIRLRRAKGLVDEQCN